MSNKEMSFDEIYDTQLDEPSKTQAVWKLSSVPNLLGTLYESDDGPKVLSVEDMNAITKELLQHKAVIGVGHRAFRQGHRVSVTILIGQKWELPTKPLSKYLVVLESDGVGELL